ncbi:hypothetical protein N2152v2_003728 [Parachlorella kessleri]
MALPYFNQLPPEGELYQWANTAVLPAWGLLMLFPRSKLTSFVVVVTAISASLLYSGLITNLLQSSGVTKLSELQTLDGYAKALQGPGALLTSWVHYLGQDLWVAKYLTGDASNKRIPRLAMLPVLLLSLLFGPAGPLAYFAIVRPLFGKSAITHKGKQQGAAKQAQQPQQQAAPSKQQQQQQQPQAAAAPHKNGAAKSAKAAAQAPAKKVQQHEASTAPKDTAAPKSVAVPAKASQQTKNGSGKGAKVPAAEAAPKKPVAAAPKPAAAPAPQADIEDDRAFAEAAAALLRSRAQQVKK